MSGVVTARQSAKGSLNLICGRPGCPGIVGTFERGTQRGDDGQLRPVLRGPRAPRGHVFDVQTNTWRRRARKGRSGRRRDAHGTISKYQIDLGDGLTTEGYFHSREEADRLGAPQENLSAAAFFGVWETKRVDVEQPIMKLPTNVECSRCGNLNVVPKPTLPRRRA